MDVTPTCVWCGGRPGTCFTKDDDGNLRPTCEQCKNPMAGRGFVAGYRAERMAAVVDLPGKRKK